MYNSGLQAYNALKNEYNLYNIKTINQQSAKQLALRVVESAISTKSGVRRAIQLYTDISLKKWY
jgi:hypothetical protein